MTLERVLLQTIKFDLQVLNSRDLNNLDTSNTQVDHPYSALLKYAKCLKGDKPKLQKMVGIPLTWNKALFPPMCNPGSDVLDICE